MPAVTGNLKDIIGSSMDGREGVLIFTLNAANVVVGNGGVRPDTPYEVTPSSSGDFTVNLEATTGMFMDAWYTVSVRWLQGANGPQGRAAALESFLDLQVRVPSGGGRIDQLLSQGHGPGGAPGPNGRVVWVSQSPPSKPRPWQLWLQQEPGENPDPFDPKNTGNLHEWRP